MNVAGQPEADVVLGQDDLGDPGPLGDEAQFNAAVLRIRERYGPAAIVALYRKGAMVRRTPINDWRGLLATLNLGGLFPAAPHWTAMLSAVSPNGAGPLDDLAVSGLKEMEATWLQVVVQEDDRQVVYRRIYDQDEIRSATKPPRSDAAANAERGGEESER